MKAKIIYDPVTGAGALYFDGVQLCDVQLPDGQRKAINQLITQHILKKKGV